MSSAVVSWEATSPNKRSLRYRLPDGFSVMPASVSRARNARFFVSAWKQRHAYHPLAPLVSQAARIVGIGMAQQIPDRRWKIRQRPAGPNPACVPRRREPRVPHFQGPAAALFFLLCPLCGVVSSGRSRRSSSLARYICIEKPLDKLSGHALHSGGKRRRVGCRRDGGDRTDESRSGCTGAVRLTPLRGGPWRRVCPGRRTWHSWKTPL